MPTEDSARIEALFQAKDPLGEIRRHAEALYQKAGSPTGQGWTDFFEQAEEDLLSGRGTAAAKPQTFPAAVLVAPKVVDPELLALTTDSSQPLAAIAASTFERWLNEHEALSFAYTLRNNRFIMTNAVELKASSIGDISEILARVAGEYSTNFIAQELVSNSSPTANFTGIPLARRVAYWNEKITQYFESDQALSFADRNTIMRVRTTLANYPNLKEIVFLDPGPAILE